MEIDDIVSLETSRTNEQMIENLITKYKSNLHDLRKKWNDSKKQLNGVEIVLTATKVKEIEVRKRIKQLQNSELDYRLDCEKIQGEINKVSIMKKGLEFKVLKVIAAHEAHAKILKSFENDQINLNVDEYFKSKYDDEEFEVLDCKVELLRKQIEERKARIKQLYLECKQTTFSPIMNPTKEKLLVLKKNIDKIETNIRTKRVELKKLSK